MSAEQSSGYDRPVLAIVLTCVGFAFFTISDAAVKMLSMRYELLQVLFMGGLTNVFLLSALGLARQGTNAFKTKRLRWHVLRAVVVGSCFGLNVFALETVEMATFYTLVFTAPFWVALLAAFLLKDKIGANRMIAILIGFAAVVYMLRPDGGLLNLGTVALLLSGFLFACAQVIVRFMGAGENKLLFVLSGSIVNVLIATPFMPALFEMPSLYDFGVVLVFSVTACIGMFSIVSGMQMASSASSVAPFHYTQIIWGSLLGYVLFAEVPDPNIIIGSAVLIATGLYVIHHEARTARRNKRMMNPQ